MPMFQWYQNLPQHINPAAFSIGPVEIRWYALMYLAGFLVVYWLIKKELKEAGTDGLADNKNGIPKEIVGEFIIYAALGLIIGARLGYVFFYNFSYFWENPLMVISPYDLSNKEYVGISGMSFFGGLIGAAFFGIIYLKNKKIDIWKFSEYLAPAIPAGYFFGRIGNFLNGELFGRPTQKFWGMYFPLGNSLILRHPSQLYEAFFEGLFLFFILRLFKKKSPFPGFLFSLYLLGYSVARFIIEFFREPDPEVDLVMNTLTRGQFFSAILVVFSIILGLYLFKKGCYNESNNKS
jgi:phosphatidylglycerol---prolipoprotein diacylglyceryl transferase